jgi:hypothetical protein
MFVEVIVSEAFEKWTLRQQDQRKEIIELQELDEVSATRLIRDWERHDRAVFELCSSYPELSEYIPRVLNIGFEVARSRLFLSGGINPENEPQVFGWALTLWKAIWKGTKIRVGGLVTWRDRAVLIWGKSSSDMP